MADANDNPNAGAVADISEQLGQFVTELITKVDDVIIGNVGEMYQQIVNPTLPILGAILFCWIIFQSFQFMHANADIKKQFQH